MEEEIKILENLAGRTRPIAEDLETAVCSIDEQLAIRNLIARYKELEENNIELQKYMKDYLIPKSTINLVYIPKSKLLELKEKVHNELDKNGITRGYQLIVDEYFDKILED